MPVVSDLGIAAGVRGGTVMNGTDHYRRARAWWLTGLGTGSLLVTG